MSNQPRILVAVLLNPPGASTGARTRNAVQLAGRVLGFDSTEIVNLTTTATPTVVELNQSRPDGWLEARAEIRVRLGEADALLGGWGTTGLHGLALRSLRSQVSWLAAESIASGLDGMWTVGGRPRHPSRWHQYVADKHGRATGPSFAGRLKQVLVQTPFTTADMSRASASVAISVRDIAADSRYDRSMSRRQQFAEIIPRLVAGRDSATIAELYAAIERSHPNLINDEVEPGTGAIRWKHEFRWELETLVVNGLVRRRKDLGRGVYSAP